MVFYNISRVFKKLACFVFLVVVCCETSGCLSVLKADRLVYAGSVGKKVDAVLIDSISNVDVKQDK